MVAPVFIDAAGAAEILRIPLDAVLDLIGEGRLRTFGGKAANPFVRSADVSVLAAELGIATTGAAEPKRVKSASTRVQTRLTADARWADVSESDIRDWVRRVDPARRQAGKVAATTAVERLQMFLRAIDEEAAG
jgi:hypothetical protein